MSNAFNPYKAPTAYQVESASISNEMSWRQIWFSFEGRISRSTFWLKGVLPLYGILVAFCIVYGILAVVVEQVQSEALSTSATVLGMILLVVGLCVFFWIQLAIYVKRWHDRGKSGWWQLIALIPYLGSLWAFIECGCLAGNPGPNQFGPDPLDR
ncbi:uncharacterized protein SOCE26_014600 [Sorangium cellulosum]|uniref:DUF805 domain-containing protein n=1 Tax=Sorangium cellulosum TaxID=56 RepID=A0A2L0EL98_SORCE|nr:DUF805 domain-containing protein [Sorangium cellulosum]AUX40064.1 uncharacterized protein SOCE26_014600 [Sorangium cellulosum]